ncbi:hypothetical protein HN954_02490 [bacterium]|jgi:hypothetical protein|nr:hypothetical protein [bacterium]MBT6831629.1 hypothetical protein [bacterium]MBT6996274.1 hypothetical protein [bacterium]MBT7772952.1 hypothetical protein [bacterium]
MSKKQDLYWEKKIGDSADLGPRVSRVGDHFEKRRSEKYSIDRIAAEKFVVLLEVKSKMSDIFFGGSETAGNQENLLNLLQIQVEIQKVDDAEKTVKLIDLGFLRNPENENMDLEMFKILSDRFFVLKKLLGMTKEIIESEREKFGYFFN